MTAPRPSIQAHTVITAHANADFDALAAMIAASKLYPGATLIFPGSQEKTLHNFYIQSTTYLFNFKNFKEIDQDSVKLLVVVDTRQASRLAHVAPLIERPDMVIHTYDHHPDSAEDIPAARSLVRPWGSCTAILVDRLQEEGLKLNVEEATILGLGIFEDTGSFTFASTTSHDFAAAGWLREHGMDLNVIGDLLNRELSAEQVGILSDLLHSATTHDIHGVDVVITQISTENFVSDFAFLVHKMMEMENIRVLFAVGRMGDRIHVVARSKNPDVDVGQICTSLGGGGHSYAASATVKDRTQAEVCDELFALLYSLINPHLVVEGLMSRPAVTIEDDRSIRDAVEIMTRFSIKTLPVVREGTQKTCGLLDHDIADKAVAHKLGDMPVSEYMVQEFSVVPPSTDLYAVMEIILGKRQRIVPVEQDDAITGVITRTDLVNLLIEEPSRIPESLLPDRSRERNIRSIMRNRLPRPMYNLLVKAGELAQAEGAEAYAVGGFVRDILLARKNLDLDLVIEGDGIAFAHKLAAKMGCRVKEHQKFKTAVVIFPDDFRVDVATARLEYYEHPAALPTVELSSIKMDLYRRDFTINALAVRLNPTNFGQLADFFGAQADLRDKVIRVLHSLSFVEDPTRILRAVRFEQRFGFQIGGQTLKLIKNALQLHLVKRLSRSRLFHDLNMIMEEDHPLHSLNRLDELGVLSAIDPRLRLDDKRRAILQELDTVQDWYRLLFVKPAPMRWKLYFLGLCMGEKRAEIPDILNRLGLTAREARNFLTLRDAIGSALGRLMGWNEAADPPSRLYFILDPLPVEAVLFLMAKSRREPIRKHISQFLANVRFKRLDISGLDLKQMGLPPGPLYARILRWVRAQFIDGFAPDRTAQMALARRLIRYPELLNDNEERPTTGS